MLAVGDVSACFRNNPWTARDKCLTAIRDVADPSLIRIDHVISFGFASGPGNAGEVMDAVIDVLGAIGILARKWVDDFIFQNSPIFTPPASAHPGFPLTANTVTFIAPPHPLITVHSPLTHSRKALPHRLPPGESIPDGYTSMSFDYDYCLDDINRVTSQLGIPWAMQKWQEFAFEVDYLGFSWDSWHKRVYLPDAKRLKYLTRINALLGEPHITLQPLEKVHGCLMHVTFVIRAGLSQLPSLQRAIQGFKGSRFVKHTLTSTARRDLLWWRSTLAQSDTFHALINRGTPINRQISVDASKEFGIGICMANAYKAWIWKPGALGQGRRDIGGAEAIALEFALRYIDAMGIRDELTRVLGDNKGAIGAYGRGRGRNVWTNEAVQRTWELQEAINCELDVVYVRSADNPADKVSQGDFSGLSRLPFSIPVTVLLLSDTFTEWPVPRSVGRRRQPQAQLMLPSPYRPQVAAADRIFCWSAPRIIAERRVTLAQPWRVQVALDREHAYESAWELSTRTGHGAGLLRYAEYCALRNIPEYDRFPIPVDLVAAFIGWAAGQLGSSGVRTWLAGLQAWHTVHGFTFPPTDSGPIRVAMMAIAKLAPIKSKKPPRTPVTLVHLHTLYNGLSFTNTFDIAVWAVACIAFWGLARLGEITVPSLRFVTTRHVCRSTSITWATENQVSSVSIDIPWTKTTQTQGATILLTRERNELACPLKALRMHLKANQALPADAHLFGYIVAEGGWRPMIKSQMMDRCEEIWKAAQLNVPSGHSFRIGGTSHLLSRGTDVQIVQKLGRWSSDAFFLYWRNAQAIIPLHVSTAAEQNEIRQRVETHLEGADSELLKAWQSIEAQQKEAKRLRARKPKHKPV